MAESLPEWPTGMLPLLNVELAEDMVAPIDACPDCGKMRTREAIRCSGCAHEHKAERRRRARLLLRQGYSAEEVAEHLGLSIATVGGLRGR